MKKHCRKSDFMIGVIRMRIAYLDCIGGISGNMCLGALLDAGLPLDSLEAELRKLPLDDYQLRVESVKRGPLGATLVEVVERELTHHKHEHRSWTQIKELILTSSLSPSVKSKSLAVFERLAIAEATIHRCPLEALQFHEVGAIDSIVDIVGTVAGFDLLGVEKIFCSPLPMGSGFVNCAHGVLPLPAPATLELLKGFPVYSVQVTGETVTPTGAALVTSLATAFGTLPAQTIERIGYGAGSNERSLPNVLRLVVGEEMANNMTSPHNTLDQQTSVCVLETNIDDMNPEWYAYVAERLFSEGALDVFLTPVQMKKNRPGTLLTVLSAPELADRLCVILLEETTTLGVRIREERRFIADRFREVVPTPYGEIRVKFRKNLSTAVTSNIASEYFAPEFEDCRLAAKTHGVPLWVVYDAVRSQFLKQKRDN